MQGIDTIAIAQLSSHGLRVMLAPASPVVIVGSGASLWEPTVLPTGQEFTDAVWKTLFQTAGLPVVSADDWNLLYGSPQDSLLCDVPFELIMEHCPDQRSIGQILSQLYSTRVANPVHEALALLAQRGLIHSIITTNYDLGLDTALSQGQLHRVVSKSDVRTNSGRIYFKIHGSADDPAGMVYSLSLESELEPWKRALLYDCLSGRLFY